MDNRKEFLDEWARHGKPPSALPENPTVAAKQGKREKLPPKAGAQIYIGIVEEMDDCGVLADKTGQQRFMIVADVLAEFIGQKVRVTITPITGGQL